MTAYPLTFIAICGICFTLSSHRNRFILSIMDFAAIQPGRMLGRFHLEEKLGSGGMGEVYRATDTRLHRSIAIKVLRPAVSLAPEHFQRFEIEARAASSLNHPHIVTVYDAGVDYGVPWIAMEFVEGRTVRKALAEGPIPREELFPLAIGIAEGLAKAHEEGIVHRDLKPENVMIGPGNSPKIVDFGLAKLTASVQNADGETQAITNTGAIQGTLSYMSPEQLLGQTVDHRADQFSFGVMLYEMATGIHPFWHDIPAQTLASILKSEPNISLAPGGLRSILARCLQKDPALRFTSTQDLVRSLRGTEHASFPPLFLGTGGKTPALIASAVAGIALLGGAVWFVKGLSKHRAPSIPIVAVRSFKNLSADPAQEYFSSGIADEIRSRLSKVSSIHLLGRSVVEAYRDQDARKLASDLGADKVVEGTVRADKDHVRVGVELVDARTQQTLWSDQFDRRLDNILSVQSDVALRIVDALRASLTPDEHRRIGQRTTENAAAYDLYLQALHHARRGDRDSRARTISLLKQAVELDPHFAQAMAEISYNIIFIADPRDVGEALNWAQKAVSVDSQSAAAQEALGLANAAAGLLTKAKTSLRRATELDPNNSPPMSNLSEVEGLLGEFDESLSSSRRGVERNPLHPPAYFHVAMPLLMLSSHGEFERWMAIWKERYPGYRRFPIVQAFWLMRRGHLAEALARAREVLKTSPGYQEALALVADLATITGAKDAEALSVQSFAGAWDPIFLDGPLLPESGRVRMAWFRLQRGDRAGAEKLLNEANHVAMDRWRAGVESPVVPMDIAAIHSMRGETNDAIEWLETAYLRGWRDPDVLRLDPMLAGARSEPRFDALVQRIRADLRRMEEASPDIRDLFEKTVPNLPPLTSNNREDKY